MAIYIVRRLLQMIPLLFLVSLVAFALIELQPGDPIIDSIRFANPEITAEELQHMRELYGVDKPIPIKYAKWLGRALQGDFGASRVYRIPAWDFLVERRLGNTLALSLLALTIALSVSIPTGIFVAIRQYSVADTIVSFLNFIGFSTPVFWLGIMLIVLTSLIITKPTTQGAPTAPFEGKVTSIEEIEIPNTDMVVRNIVVTDADGKEATLPLGNFKPRVREGARVSEGQALGVTRKELLPAGGFSSGVRAYTTEGSPRAGVAGVASVSTVEGQTVISIDGYLGKEDYTLPKGFQSAIEDGQRVRNNQVLGQRYTWRSRLAFLRDRLYYLILPAFALSVISMASWTRFMRASMLEVMNQDYVRTARSKGLNERKVNYKHALRNALIPIITLIGLALPGLVNGAVLTETVFNYPGMGTALLESLVQKDYNIAMAAIVLFSFLTVIGNLVADVAYAFVDPRITYS